MKATKRLKRKRVSKTTRINSKRMKEVEVVKDYTDPFTGRAVLLRSLPTKIKRAKRLFEVGKIYKIEKPADKKINSLGAVYLKGKDKNLYCVQFPHWSLTAN